jgi:hypothetical protein
LEVKSLWFLPRFRLGVVGLDEASIQQLGPHLWYFKGRGDAGRQLVSLQVSFALRSEYVFQVGLQLQAASVVLMALRRLEDREPFTADELFRQRSSLDDPKIGLAPEVD